MDRTDERWAEYGNMPWTSVFCEECGKQHFSTSRYAVFNDTDG